MTATWMINSHSKKGFSLAISKIEMIFQPFLIPWYHSWSEKQSRRCEYFRNNLLRERYYFSKIPLQNRYCSASLPSKIEIVATPSERHLPTAMSNFTQGIWFWNWFWKTIGKIDLDFKWVISLKNQFSLSKLPTPQMLFTSSDSLLNA